MANTEDSDAPHSCCWAQVASHTRAPALSPLTERHTRTLVLPIAGT